MAQRPVTAPAYVARLKRALEEDLKDANVVAELVRGDRYRFVIVAAHFNGVGHPERQERVWRVAQQILNAEDLLNVAMILTVADDEVTTRGGEEQADVA